jgi:hypothetical protein
MSTSRPVATRIGICLHAYVLDQFDITGRALGRSRERLHPGIHQARKSIRRIRATLDLGRKKLWPDAAPLFDELRNLCRRLSLVRDAHAVVETLDRLFKRCGDPDLRLALRRVRQKLIAGQAATLERLLKQDPGLRRYRMRLRSLRDNTEALHWNEIDAADIRAALAGSERRIERAAEKAKHTRHGPMRHRWRRRLRRMRHQMQILESALDWRFVERTSSTEHQTVSTPEWSAVVRDSIQTLEHTADALAFEHDLRVLRNTLRKAPGIRVDDRSRALKLLRHEFARASKL